MQEFGPPPGFEPLALLLWGLSGAIVARRKSFDVTGVLAIALVSATGGGILRDGLFLNQRVLLLDRPDYLLTIAVATVVVILVGGYIERITWWERLVAIIDAAGTPMFAVLGTAMSLNLGVSPAGALLVGTVNGVGGGILRDLLVGDIPQALRPGQFYGIVVVLACAVYEVLVLSAGWNEWAAGWTVIVMFIIVRLLSIQFNWRTFAVNEWQLPTELSSQGRYLRWPRRRPTPKPSPPTPPSQVQS